MRLERVVSPDEAADLLKGYRVVSLGTWRPLKTVYKDPFAVMDTRTLSRAEFIPNTVIVPNTTEKSYMFSPSKNHRWHYVSHQQPDEVLFFKHYDSAINTTNRFTPHSAFRDVAYEDRDARQNVELRLFLLFEKEE